LKIVHRKCETLDIACYVCHMARVQVADVESLFNGYRSVLDGTCSASTPPVPPVLAGYTIDDATGARRPLGEVRRLLLAEIKRVDAITGLEYAVLSLYYGLDGVTLPITSNTGRTTIAALLPPLASHTGRPRKRDWDRLGSHGARYARTKALTKLARRWSARELPDAVPMQPAADPTGGTWFRHATRGWSDGQRSQLVHEALRRARRDCGPFPEIRRSYWVDLDWWAHHARVSVLSHYGVGRPTSRINAERIARANARMEIALWEALLDDDQPRTPAAPRHAGRQLPDERSPRHVVALLIPPDDVKELLAIRDPVHAAREAIATLEQQGRHGACDKATALVLGWLEPHVLGALDDEDLTRAAADHEELAGVGLSWYEAALRQRVAPHHLAEGALNLSVAYSARRRYSEAEGVLTAVAMRVQAEASSRRLLAIGRAAWRRRAVSEAIGHRRPVGDNQMQNLVRFGLAQAVEAVAHAKESADLTLGALLRAQVREGEAVAVASAYLQLTVSSKSAIGALRDEAWRVHERVTRDVQQWADRAEITAYDLARIEVIGDIATSIDNGAPMTKFGILERVSRLAGPTHADGSG
jgi:hypothetical protein